MRSLLRYVWRAQTVYDVHAPLAYDFVREVIEDTRHLYAYERVEALRRRYLNDASPVSYVDHGAGSDVGDVDAAARVGTRPVTRSVRDVANASATSPRFARYLYRLGDWLRPATVLELGTNLGVGTAALASGLPPGSTLYTIDAAAALQDRARREVPRVAEDAHVEYVTGPFADRLPEALARAGSVDLAFLDGHHVGEATYVYFEQILASASPSAVLVVDDIHWSRDMEAAWRRIQRHPAVRLSVDLYQWGVIFLGPRVAAPQHLHLVPWQYKPWHMGFFTQRAG